MDKKAKIVVKYLVLSAIIVGIFLVPYAIAPKPGGGGGPKTQCNDHVDNDGDGYCDYAWKKAYCSDNSIVGDPDCTSKDDNDESDTSFCGDGVCNGAETCSSCEVDCGICPISNSCEDTDGGFVVTVKGTVSGYKNGNPYSYTDYCNVNGTLVENYCLDTLRQAGDYNCAVDAKTCIDGACV